MPDFLYYSVAWLSLFFSALFGLGFLVIRFMPLRLPIRVFYAFFRFRRGVLAAALASAVAVSLLDGLPTGGWILIGLQFLFLLIDPITDESRIFRAVEAPEFEEDPSKSTLNPKAPVIVLEIGGDVHAYPLAYVAHHEVINDSLGNRKVVVSFCNQCNAPMSYDTTAYSRKRGFVVASEYRGNLVMKDLDTHSIWQQFTGKTLAGSRHPSELSLLFSRMLPWGEAQSIFPQVKLAKTNAKERLPFSLRFFPWNRLQKSNYTLGLRHRDLRLPARARVLGIERIGGDMAYVKDEVTRKGWIRNDEARLLIVMVGECADGFLTEVDGHPRELFVRESRIVDRETGSVWNLRGRGLAGPLRESDLVVWQVRDLFWFAWSDYHRLTKLLRVEAQVVES